MMLTWVSPCASALLLNDLNDRNLRPEAVLPIYDLVDFTAKAACASGPVSSFLYLVLYCTFDF